MKIGVIGSGMIGGTAARLFARAGHEVALSNRRGPDSLRGAVEEMGPAAHAVTIEEAAAFGDVVLVAVPFIAYSDLPAAAFAGKIVVDAGNYYPQRDGQIDFGGLTSTELVARHLAGARVVKAFNTMYYETLAGGGRPSAAAPDRLALLVAGDDPEAKATVSRLIEDIGLGAVDTGSLREGGRLQQPDSPLYNVPMTVADARQRLSAAR